MRCKSCGWPNKAGETTCSKCGSPLTGGSPEVPAYGGGEAPAPTVAQGMGGYEAPRPSQPSQQLNKTVLESEVFGRGFSEPDPAPQEAPRREAPAAPQTPTQCPKCGYPLRQGVDKCPNCKFQVGGVRSEPRHEEAPAAEPHRPTRMASAGAPSNKFKGTVNPYMMNLEADPWFSLRPIKKMGERHELQEREYDGKEVVLNRGNTEEENPSITSRQQAVVTNVEGHWYIEDKSEQKTTFVQAAKPIELHDGDIILLGNRLFEFHSNQDGE